MCRHCNFPDLIFEVLKTVVLEKLFHFHVALILLNKLYRKDDGKINY